MKEMVQQMLEVIAGVKVTPEDAERLALRFQQMVARHEKLMELDLWREEPIVSFSREREL